MILINFFGTDRESKIILNENKKLFLDLIKSGKSLQGKFNLELEKKIQKILFNKKINSSCTTVGSATDGLFFALKSLNLPKKSIIGCPSISFIATASSIIRAGHVPFFLDLDEYGLICPKFLKANKKKLDALIYVSLYGNNQNYPQIVKIIDSDIPIVEDAAQSDFPGCYYFPKEKKPNFSILSFDPTKIFSCLGSGGAVISYEKKNDIENIKSLKYHGHNGMQLGYNSQLSEISAAFVNIKINYHLKQWHKKRIENSNKIIEALDNKVFKSIYVNNGYHAAHKLVIMSLNKNNLEVQKILFKMGLETKIHYLNSLPSLDLYKKFNKSNINIKSLNKFCKSVITIPNYPLLKKSEIKKITGLLNSMKNFI